MEAEPFAAAVLKLLGDPTLREEFAKRGPAYVRTHRTYDILARNVVETYKRILPDRA
jgi:hypothetical protein